MELTPLMRFVCATLTMRRTWEGGSSAVGSVGAIASCRSVRRSAPTSPPVMSCVEPKHENDDAFGATFKASPCGVSELDDTVRDWMVALEVAMVEESDQAAAEIVRRVCEDASGSGAFSELVGVWITAILDLDEAASSETQQGFSEVILCMCFERSERGGEPNGGTVVQTPYCFTVVDQITATMRDLRDLVGEDELCAHIGGRLLDRTLRLVVDNLGDGNDVVVL